MSGALSSRIGVSAAAMIASPFDTAPVSLVGERSQLPPWLAWSAGKGTGLEMCAEVVTRQEMRDGGRYVNGWKPIIP